MLGTSQRTQLRDQREEFGSAGSGDETSSLPSFRLITVVPPALLPEPEPLRSGVPDSPWHPPTHTPKLLPVLPGGRFFAHSAISPSKVPAIPWETLQEGDRWVRSGTWG